MTFDMLGDLIIWKKKIFLGPGVVNDVRLDSVGGGLLLSKVKDVGVGVGENTNNV